jgi:thymidine phosphorylase
MFAGEALSRLGDVAMGEGRARAATALDSGEALETFRRMIEAQGGDPRVVDDPGGVLPAAPVVVPVTAAASGSISRIDAEELGRASSDLGAGRRSKGDPIDPAVGIVYRGKIGDRVTAGEDLGAVHARTEDEAAACVARIAAAVTIADEQVGPPPLVYGWYGG